MTRTCSFLALLWLAIAAVLAQAPPTPLQCFPDEPLPADVVALTPTTPAQRLRYYAAGPGANFTIPSPGFWLTGFAIKHYAGSLNCGNPDYATNFGCMYDDYEYIEPHGFAEYILQGTSALSSPVLVPVDADPTVVRLYDVTGPTHTGEILFYDSTICNFADSHVLRLSLPEPTFFAPGEQLSLWHSEARSNENVADNGGSVRVVIYGFTTSAPPTPVPTPEPTRVPTEVPTPEPTPEPTPLPTMEPTLLPPVPAFSGCSAAGSNDLVSFTSPPEYNTSAPIIFSFPSPSRWLSGFMITFVPGHSGIRCDKNTPWNPESYLGCAYKNGTHGWAEHILRGTTASSEVLVPVAADPTVTNIRYAVAGTNNILFYDSTQCIHTKLATQIRLSLDRPKYFYAGEQLSLWHSKLLYNIGPDDNTGKSKVAIKGYSTPAPTPAPP